MVPILYRIAIPMLARKNTGMIQQSMNKDSTTQDKTTAISTYSGVSFSDNALISVTTADMLLR